MEKDENQPNAEKLESLIIGMEDSKAVTIVKPELIEPIIRRRIDELQEEINELQKCTSTFSKSPMADCIVEAIEIGISSEVVEEIMIGDYYLDYKKIPGKRREAFNDFYARPKRGDIGLTHYRWLPTKNEYQEVSCKPQITSCTKIESTTIETMEEIGIVEKTVKKKFDYDSFNYEVPSDMSYHEGNFLIKMQKSKIKKIHKVAPASCAGKCKEVNIVKHLTGTEIRSDRVTARVQEVLKNKINERQKYENLYLNLISKTIDQIEG
jgi:hypothetical protein